MQFLPSQTTAYGTPDAAPAVRSDGVLWSATILAGRSAEIHDIDAPDVEQIIANALGDSDFESTTSPETISGSDAAISYYGMSGGRHAWLTIRAPDIGDCTAEVAECDADVSLFPD